jgi:hypothetical protein
LLTFICSLLQHFYTQFQVKKAMSTKRKRESVVAPIDDEQDCYVLQASENRKVEASLPTLRTSQKFTWKDLQLAGLGTLCELTNFILKEECIDSHSESTSDNATPTLLTLPPQYTNSVLDTIEGFVLKLKLHERYKTKRTKALKHETSSTPALSDVFQDRTLEDLYLLLEFAHEYDVTTLANAVATWLLEHKGLEVLCMEPPKGHTAAAVGLEMAKVISEEQKLQLLQLGTTTNCDAFFWLDIIQCSGFSFKGCTQEQQKQKHLLRMGLPQYAGYLKRSDNKGVLSLDFSGCTWLTDDDLQLVSRLQSVRSLNLSGCTQITNAGLPRLGNLPSLKRLTLYDCKEITNAGLVHLQQVISPQLLDLSSWDKTTSSGLVVFTSN